MSRTVTLVVIDSEIQLLGALPSFPVDSPWWNDVEPVVAVAHARFGASLSVLRLLSAERAHPPGGAVTYLAELDPDAREGLDLGLFEPVSAQLEELALGVHRLRAPWAEPGGPARSVAWAKQTLSESRKYDATQLKTWNLSAIWRLRELGKGPDAPTAWLKQVPAFFAHEATILDWLGAVARGAAPRLIARGKHGRTLLADVTGPDRFGAEPAERDVFAKLAHSIQLEALRAADDLAKRGVPDRRGLSLAGYLRAALARVEQGNARSLIETLDARVAAVVECGVPDTLVHGDLHPGNVRGLAAPVLLDWGDAFLGHPGFDILRLSEGCSPAAADALITAWSRRWQKQVPGCDPARALGLLRPIAKLRSAAAYAEFVRHIERTEHPYHADDVPDCLAAAAEAASVPAAERFAD
jgi:hypothetical protein